MRTSSLLMIVLGIVLAVSLAAIWFYPSSQDFMDANTFWNGMSDFTHRSRAENLDSLDGLPDQPDNAVLISIPCQEYSAADFNRIKRFVDNGGTLLLMDDFGRGNDILQFLGLSARFDHNILLDPLFCYKNQYLPRVMDFAPAIAESGIQALNFNHAAILSHVEDWQVLAQSSITSYLDTNKNGKPDKDETSGPFAVAAENGMGKGEVKLVSDPSILINAMLGQNDNEKFISYLTAGQGGTQNVMIDRSHLSPSPLDTSKMKLEAARGILSSPYLILGLIALFFILIARYTLKKGELFG